MDSSFLQTQLSGAAGDFSYLASIGQGKISLPESGLSSLISTVALHKLEDMAQICDPESQEMYQSMLIGLEKVKNHPEIKLQLVDEISLENRRVAEFVNINFIELSKEDASKAKTVSLLKKLIIELKQESRSDEDLTEFMERTQRTRVNIAKNCLQINFPGALSLIKEFGIKSERDFIAIAKLCAKQNGGLTAENIEEFPIKNPTALVEIAKLCAKQDGGLTAKYIEKFKINDPLELVEIAKLCAKQNGAGTARFIKSFQIKDETVLIEIAKLCAKQDGGGTAENIKNFQIKSEEALIEIAKLCAKQDGGWTAMNVGNFQIKSEEALIEIAKLCAKQKGGLTARYIEKFQIKSQEALIEIAKICAKQDGANTAENIDNFQIENPKSLIEIAKLCAEENGQWTAKFIENFQIKSEEALIEIAKICAKQNGRSTAENIQNFQIIDQAALIEIAKICAKQDGRGTAQYIQNFQITDQAALIEIAKLCAEESGDAAPYIDNFRIGEEDASFRTVKEHILTLCVRHHPECLLDPDNLQDSFFETADRFVNSADRKEEIRKYLQSKNDPDLLEVFEPIIRQITLDTSPFSSFPEAERIKKIEEAKAIIERRLNLLIPLIWMVEKRLPESEWKKVFSLFPMIDSYRSPTMKWPLFLEVIELAARPNFPIIDGGEEGWITLQKLLSVRLVQEGISSEKLILVLERVYNNKNFRDGKNQRSLHEATYLLLKEDRIDLTVKEHLLDKMISNLPKTVSVNPTKNEVQQLGIKVTQFLRDVQQITPLLFLATPEFLGSLNDQTISQMLEHSFREAIPMGSMADFGKKYAEKITSSRMPNAFARYTGKLKSLGDENVLNDIGVILTAILNDQWHALRHSSVNNPHLQKLEENHSAVLKEWFKPTSSFSLSEVAPATTESSFSQRGWLKQKLVDDSHLGDLFNLDPLLLNFLRVEDPEEIERIQGEIRALSQKNILANRIVSLANAKTHDEEVSALKELLKLPEVKEAEFKNDIEGRLNTLLSVKKSSSDSYVVVDTEEWIDLLLCGVEIAGSCQRIDGNPNLNKGLLGYMRDGKIRMIAIKDKEGPEGTLVARALIKLLWDGTKPVLFFERVYDNEEKPLHTEALLKMATRKAEALGVPLVSLEGKGERYSKNLESIGGSASFEYSDGSQGIKIKGIYTVSNARIVA